MRNSISNRIRLDQLLTNRGIAVSRSRARDMVSRGCVKVDGVTVQKAGHLVDRDEVLEVDDPAQRYVSRAALKLVAALEASGIEPKGKTALDLGASTGGFTQVLLERGVKSVTALDVGHGQLDSKIAKDPRVTNLERFNARHLTTQNLLIPPNLVVSDMSFVSLRVAAEAALMLSASQAACILLVKPQFEVGKAGIGKGGIVSNENLIEETNNTIKQWFLGLPGWSISHFIPSPLLGGDGNREFLLCGTRNG